MALLTRAAMPLSSLPSSQFLSSTVVTVAATILLFTSPASAHGGHAEIPDGAAITDEPIDSTLWIHILLMILSFGIIFPLGMVLGIVKSRWHVPVQLGGSVIAVVAYFLGHMHKGREFAKPNVHATFANAIVLGFLIQVGLGMGLKLHLEQKGGWIGKVFGSKIGNSGRGLVVLVHGVLGKVMPIVGWVQMLFGGITAMGFCRGDHLGQCVAHFIMGSAFIGYGIVITILLLVGQAWLRRSGKSQEFFDSMIIAVWGCVNTFTEHRWGGAWVKNDIQHTTMGIVWWAAGLLGLWLSRSRGGRPRRNVLPGIVLILTGWAMSAHPQDLPLSTMVHTAFGYTLMAAGAVRIIEISFLLKDSRGGGEASSWQHLTPFLLFASGFLFMGATEEQMAILAEYHVSHVAYVLIMYSIALLLYLFVNVLLHIYATHAWPDDESNGQIALSRHMSRSASVAGFRAHKKRLSSALNGEPVLNGHMRTASTVPRHHRPTDSQQVRDAEEFELEGLISEDDDRLQAHRKKGKEEV